MIPAPVSSIIISIDSNNFSGPINGKFILLLFLLIYIDTIPLVGVTLNALDNKLNIIFSNIDGSPHTFIGFSE